mmetsp:Transcript_10708/g.25901  ORF Transcript_10708/g.25901 Transcript_10708/m.25901 type:complete len:126 (-) Transcript_10708:1191-1568(-)
MMKSYCFYHYSYGDYAKPVQLDILEKVLFGYIVGPHTIERLIVLHSAETRRISLDLSQSRFFDKDDDGLFLEADFSSGDILEDEEDLAIDDGLLVVVSDLVVSLGCFCFLSLFRLRTIRSSSRLS